MKISGLKEAKQGVEIHKRGLLFYLTETPAKVGNGFRGRVKQVVFLLFRKVICPDPVEIKNEMDCD